MEGAKDQERVAGDDDAVAAPDATPSSPDEEVSIKKKYGGIVPKKPPLISKDHERAYFDSADWALGKRGVDKPKGPLEALRPKLQPTQQQTRYRKSPYAPSNDEDGGSAGTEETAYAQRVATTQVYSCFEWKDVWLLGSICSLMQLTSDSCDSR